MNWVFRSCWKCRRIIRLFFEDDPSAIYKFECEDCTHVPKRGYS